MKFTHTYFWGSFVKKCNPPKHICWRPGIPLSSLPPSLARDAVSGCLQVSFHISIRCLVTRLFCIEYVIISAFLWGFFVRKICLFAPQIMLFQNIFLQPFFFSKTIFFCGTNLFARKANCPLQPSSTCHDFFGTKYFIERDNFFSGQFFGETKFLFFSATNRKARKDNCTLQGIAGGTFLYITFFEV